MLMNFGELSTLEAGPSGTAEKSVRLEPGFTAFWSAFEFPLLDVLGFAGGRHMGCIGFRHPPGFDQAIFSASKDGLFLPENHYTVRPLYSQTIISAKYSPSDRSTSIVQPLLRGHQGVVLIDRNQEPTLR